MYALLSLFSCELDHLEVFFSADSAWIERSQLLHRSVTLALAGLDKMLKKKCSSLQFHAWLSITVLVGSAASWLAPKIAVVG